VTRLDEQYYLDLMLIVIREHGPSFPRRTKKAEAELHEILLLSIFHADNVNDE
jgi:hypothetical protein